MKSKKILTILLSLAIMFTFMPAMAFAADSNDAIWGPDYKTATTATGNPAEVSWNYDASSGVTTATAKFGTDTVGTRYLLDLTGAEVKLAESCYVSGFTTAITSAKFVVKKPALDTATKADKEVLLGNAIGGWTVKYTTEPASVSNIKTMTPVTVTVTLESSSPHEGKTNADDSLKLNEGTYTKTINVYPDGSSHNYKFYDEATNESWGSTAAVKYDGAKHTIKIDAPNGYTVSYQKYSAKAGAYVDSAEGITYKDAFFVASGDEEKYLAVFTKNAGTTPDMDTSIWGTTKVKDGVYTKPFTLKVSAANVTPAVAWADDNKKPVTETISGANYYLTEEQAADPTAFLGVSHTLTTKDADLEELKAVFNELYEVKVVKNAADANQLTWTVVQKETDDTKFAEAVAASKKAHKALFANYKLAANGTPVSAAGVEGAANKKSVVITGSGAVINDKDDDITFSGVTTKSWKAKKKTKKLAKNKSFTVAATADSGNAITFSGTSTNKKITVSADGKVTVKKGLKKGKYSVTVKAKTAAGNGFKAATATQKYTIKIN